MATYRDTSPRSSDAADQPVRRQRRTSGGTRRTQHDVVVVGARCAGAATAMLLARAGHDVVMVDRSHPSRDTVSTHSIVRGGVVQLDRWDVLDDVVATGAPEIRSVSFHYDGDVIRRAVKDRAGVDFLLAPRRYVLDDLLARRAVASGAELLTDTTVTGVLRDDPDGRVTGVTARGADGTMRELRARLVIGADGIRSATARHVGAEVVREYDVTGSCLYIYVGGVPWDGFELYISDRAFAGVFPTHHGEANVWLIRPVDDFEPVFRAGERRSEAWLAALDEAVPSLARRIRGGEITAPLRGYAGLPNHIRRPAGPGWALVGDAGYHRDPITGHGITDAFRDAELLADAADAFLRHTMTESAAMAVYERERDSSIQQVFALTRALGAFPSKAEFLELQTRLSSALDVEAQALAERPSLFGTDPDLNVGVA
ncbi:NAD(P)/FAD-dependent oxidoreductase [Aeromicrobium sp.]|uniref:NAD(P)/FAD-dependent oxidoreductase n=1 Tax=Aeromicrobium sp. TaxID=1871063 RepID=UPI003D6BFCAF